MKKNKVDRLLSISGIVVGSFVLLYFGGGIVATYLVNENLLNVRGSDETTLDYDPYYKTQYIRKDYPLMENREVVDIPHEKETLKGYLYEVENPHGVIIAAHGVNNLSDGTNAQYHNYFLSKGWDVFTFDMIGCGLSSGKGMSTLYESRFCVDSAIKFVKNHRKTQGLPLFLVGHSWGGYGVTSASGDYEVNAVCAFSGFDAPNEMMYGFAEYYVSKAAILTKPAFELSLRTLFDKNAFYKTETSIKKMKNTKYVIVQGDKDNVVPLKEYSIYDNVSGDNYPNVIPILLHDVGHIGPWRSVEAIKYTEENIDTKLDEFRKQYGDKIPDNVLSNWLKTIDKEKSSELNYSLLNQINDIFLSTI